MNKIFYNTINWIILAPTLTGCLLTFCLVNTLLIKPLPYPNSEQLFVVSGLLSFNGIVSENNSPKLQEALLESTDLIQDMAGYHRWSEYRLTSHLQQPNIDVRLDSHNLFSLLGINAHLGRLFNDTERLGLKRHNALIGYDLWQTLFDQDKTIIGKEITLNDRIFTVVGILPKNIILPEVQDIGRAIWIPMDADDKYNPERNYGFMGNFKTVSLLNREAIDNIQQLEAYLNEQVKTLGLLTIPPGLDSEPDSFKFIANVESLQQAILGDHQPLALLSFFSCLSLFVIALINLLSLHFYKAKIGVKQAAIVMAVGASKKQYFRECLVKNGKLLIPVMACALMLSLYLLSKMDEQLVDVTPWAKS